MRRGFGVEVYDRDDLAGGPLASIPLPGDPRDVWVGDLGYGARALVASGFDTGVFDVRYDEPTSTWTSRWVADLGDVRGLAFAAEPFRPGEERSEYCDEDGGKTNVPYGSSPALFGVTEAGILQPVPVDLTAEPFGESSVVIDPTRFSLDLSSCSPKLVAGAEAILGTDPPFTLQLLVDNPSGGPDDWLSDPFEWPAEGGTFDLERADVGASVVVIATAGGGASTTRSVVDVPVVAPIFDSGQIGVTRDASQLTVTLPGGSVTRRLECGLFAAELRRVSTDERSSIDDPCCSGGGDYTGSIAAPLGEEVQLRFCNGQPIPICTSWFPLGAGLPREVDLSVRPNGDSWELSIPVVVSEGVVTFDSPLPDGPDRGDEVVFSDGSSGYLRTCADSRNCEVTTAGAWRLPTRAVSWRPASTPLSHR